MNEEQLAKSLREVMQLIDEQVLVRNTKEDHNRMRFLRQGVRLVKILKDAEEALKKFDAERGAIIE